MTNNSLAFFFAFIIVGGVPTMLLGLLILRLTLTRRLKKKLKATGDCWDSGTSPIKCKAITLGIALSVFLFSSMVVASDSLGLVPSVMELEKRLNARVGLSVHDLETGRQWQHRADERFPLSSTFKTLACGALLQRADAGREDLGRKIVFEEADLVTYSPFTMHEVGGEGVSLAGLCQATMAMSDNSAANFILKSLGGPAALTEFMRNIGDEVTRLDRWETDLNQAVPGDPRDTTTPSAMVRSLEALVLGDVLSTDTKRQLREWLKGNEVADALFRASVPTTWIVGDRTGAGGFGSRSITAVFWPPERKPVIAVLYITETDASFEARNEAIADIGRVIVDEVLRQ